ncbi:MAG: AAA family ATPase [Thermoplasmata archaeon]|nr:AAA family ATPase [Thermoplasmata archaeon]
MIIIIVGMPGSGKDIFVQSARKLGFTHIAMGDVVRTFAAMSNSESDDSSIGGFASSERQKHGVAVWAERTIARMPSGNVIIDGSRSLDEIDLFRKKLGQSLLIVAITAPAEERFRRLGLRGRDDAPQTIDDLKRRDERELSWGIGKAIGSADMTLVNDVSLDGFKIKCLALLETQLETHGKSI